MNGMSGQAPHRAEVWGTHEHTVDGKGRVSIPSDFRGELNFNEGSELFVTRHLSERCLLVFWPEAWEAFVAGIGERSDSAEIASMVRRVVCGYRRRVKLDRLGRIQLPHEQRKYSELDGKCFVMGQGRHMEIWSMPMWETTHGPDAYADAGFGRFL
jgi:MraZ protein